MNGVDLNSLTSKLVKLKLTSQLSAEQVGFLLCWEVQAGKVVRGIPLDEAAKIAERIGLPPP